MNDLFAAFKAGALAAVGECWAPWWEGHEPPTDHELHMAFLEWMISDNQG
jgi:hypothetical protein